MGIIINTISSGGGDATAANQVTQIDLATNANNYLDNIAINTDNTFTALTAIDGNTSTTATNTAAIEQETNNIDKNIQQSIDLAVTNGQQNYTLSVYDRAQTSVLTAGNTILSNISANTLGPTYVVSLNLSGGSSLFLGAKDKVFYVEDAATGVQITTSGAGVNQISAIEKYIIKQINPMLTISAMSSNTINSWRGGSATYYNPTASAINVFIVSTP